MKNLIELFEKTVFGKKREPKNMALESLKNKLSSLKFEGGRHTNVLVSITHPYPNRCLYIQADDGYNDPIAVRLTETGYSDCKFLGVKDTWKSDVNKSISSDILSVLKECADQVFDEDARLRNLGHSQVAPKNQ